GWLEVDLLRGGDVELRHVERLLGLHGTLELRILANPRKDEKLIKQARLLDTQLSDFATTWLLSGHDTAERDIERGRNAAVLDAFGNKRAWWVPVKADEEKTLATAEDVVSWKVSHDRLLDVLVVADSEDITGKYLTKAEAAVDKNGPCI